MIGSEVLSDGGVLSLGLHCDVFYFNCNLGCLLNC